MLKRVSVVIVSYRRLETLESVLKAWLALVPDVWLVDCSGGRFKTKLPITHIRFSRDVGNKSRHAVALLTEGDFVIKADDDILPIPGFPEDLLSGYHAVGGGIVGVIGRIFDGSRYYGETRFFKSKLLISPVKVDFVGVTTLAPRELLAFDLRGCSSEIEDLYWQMKVFPLVKKHVIPTTNYVNLPAAKDAGCLFKNPEARKIREAFYREYFEKYYAGSPV